MANEDIGSAVARQESEKSRRDRFRAYSAFGERYALIAVWAILVMIFAFLRPHTFWTRGNVESLLSSQSVLLVLTLGLLVPLIVGEFDLSIAGTLSWSAMLTAVLNVNLHWPILVAVGAAIASGIVIGIVNGVIVVAGVNSFIVTLGTATILYGLVSWVSSSNTISGVSGSFVGAVYLHRVLGLAPELYYALGLVLLLWFVTGYTPVGRRLIFVGRGSTVARLSGINVRRIRFGAFVVSGFASAVAGVLYAGTLGGADPTSGQSFLLPAFAAAYLGATAIRVGRFNPWGSFFAVYVLVTGVNGLQLLGAQNYVQQLFYGGVLVVAVAVAQMLRRQESRELEEAST